MATRENIYPGDTLPVAIECRRDDPDDPHNSNGLPATPISAFARLKDSDDVWLQIGGLGDTDAPATITPATGIGTEDKGAILRFTVTSAFTQTPGRYTLFITAEYADGAKLTENRRYQILEFR